MTPRWFVSSRGYAVRPCLTARVRCAECELNPAAPREARRARPEDAAETRAILISAADLERQGCPRVPCSNSSAAIGKKSRAHTGKNKGPCLRRTSTVTRRRSEPRRTREAAKALGLAKHTATLPCSGA